LATVSVSPECAPIGIFDSGLGGLSVLREIRRLLPGEHLRYIADSAWCPYGGRPVEEIRGRAHFLADVLVGAGCRALVVACNTATIAAVESLREAYSIPIIGMEPAVKPAAASTRSGVVGVLATGAALAGEKFHRLVERHAGGVRVITRPCPGLVERVEAGELCGPALEAELRGHTSLLLAEGADVVVLGCTHYPFLRSALEEILPAEIALIDTGEAVARQLERRLAATGCSGQRVGSGSVHLFTTGDLEHLRITAPLLWPEAKVADFSRLCEE